jgi:hypothetical protein
MSTVNPTISFSWTKWDNTSTSVVRWPLTYYRTDIKVCAQAPGHEGCGESQSTALLTSVLV